MNTLTYAGTTVTLDPDLLWSDEFDWSPVTQANEYSITGALHVDAAGKQTGRSITLQGGADYGHMLRSALGTLQVWRQVPGRVMQLVVRGAPAVSVVFDHQRGAIEARPLVDYAVPNDTDPYVVTLRFIQI